MFDVKLPEFKKAKYNIVDFGAVPNSLNDSGLFINKAIDECSKNGGGYVVVPKGLYMSTPIYLKSDVCLLFEDGAMIKFLKT